MEHRAIFLQPGRVACYRRLDGEYIADKEWVVRDEQLPQQLQTYFNECSHVLFDLIFDLPEEEFHLETLNKVSLRDRRYVVQRLMSKRFKQPLLSNANIIDAGHDKQLLISGIEGNVLCENLLSMLKESQIWVRSIHSSTTLVPSIVNETPASNDNCLVVMPMHNGFRLVACSKESIVFTRWITGLNSQETDNNVLEHGLFETLQYLQRQHEWYRSSVVCIGGSGVFDELKSKEYQLLASKQLMEIVFIDNPKNMQSNAESAEKKVVDSLVKAGRGYAQKSHRRAYMCHKVRNVCAAVALSSIAGVATSSAVANKLSENQEFVAASYSHSASVFKREIGNLEALYEQPVEAVRQALLAARLIDISTQEPIEVLQVFATRVNQHAGISISSVNWVADEQYYESQFDGLSNADLSRSDLSISDLSNSDLSNYSGFHELFSLEELYQVTLAGTVDGAPESAYSQFEAFVMALRSANKDPSIVVVETPFHQGKRYRSGDGDSGAGQNNFVIEIFSRNVER